MYVDRQTKTILLTNRDDIVQLFNKRFYTSFKKIDFSYSNKRLWFSTDNFIFDCTYFNSQKEVLEFFNFVKEGFIDKKIIKIFLHYTTFENLCYNYYEIIENYGFKFVPFPMNDILLKQNFYFLKKNFTFDFFKVQNLLNNEKKIVLNEFIGKSDICKKIKTDLLEASSFEGSVLILGESGTGKSFIAELLHKLSDRKNNKFVLVNSSSLSENIGVSEIFGSAKGAFTGAVLRNGYLSEANNGTIFFDEIGTISLSIQKALLTFLDTGVFYKVGSPKEEASDVRFISATNENLSDLIKKNYFRSDFYNRICDFVIKIPPLRERQEDAMLMLESFLQKNNAQNITFSNYAVDFIMNYKWPGNTRDVIRLAKFLTNRYKDTQISDEILEDWVDRYCI